MATVKYYLDQSIDDIYLLNKMNDPGIAPVCCGRLADIGITNDDPDWPYRLAEYFEKEYGILPEEWEFC